MPKLDVNTPKYWRKKSIPVIDLNDKPDDLNGWLEDENHPVKATPVENLFTRENRRVYPEFTLTDEQKETLNKFCPGAEKTDGGKPDQPNSEEDTLEKNMAKDSASLSDRLRARIEKEQEREVETREHLFEDDPKRLVERIEDQLNKNYRFIPTLEEFRSLCERVDAATKKVFESDGYTIKRSEDILDEYIDEATGEKCWRNKKEYVPFFTASANIGKTAVGLTEKSRLEAMDTLTHPGGTTDDRNTFDGIARDICELHARKNADYGDAAYESYKDFGIISYVIRLGDKYRRLKTLTSPGYEQKVKDESIEDTLKDLAAYSIMALEALKK